MGLDYCNLDVTLNARNPFESSRFIGNTLRGALGLALRSNLCTVEKKDCKDCPIKDECWYQYLFETRLNGKDNFPLSLTEAPHPFVLSPPWSISSLELGESLEFGLALFGKSLKSFPYWFVALDEMSRRGLGRRRVQFELVSIIAKDGTEVYSIRDGELKSPPIYTWSYEPPTKRITKVTVIFLSPCRLKYKGKLTDKIEFPIFFTSLLRRISAIAHFHGGTDLDIDINKLLNKSKEIRISYDNTSWVERSRFSARQRRGMKLGGVIGQISYEGDLTPFMPFLELGRVTHVGKATSFGFGRFDVKSD